MSEMKYYLQARDHNSEDGSDTDSKDSISRDKEMFAESPSEYEPEETDSDDDMQGCRTPRKDNKKK